jgi:hypothetical protein
MKWFFGAFFAFATILVVGTGYSIAATVVLPQVENNGITTLNGAITDSATTINVASAAALGLTDATTNAYLTVIDATTRGYDPLVVPETLEIVLVTAVATNALTVTRAQDGTSAKAFADGDVVELRIIAATLDRVYEAITDGTDSISVLDILAGGTITATGAMAGSNLSGTNTGDEVASSTTVSGIIELATQAEVDAGTDALRAVTPASLATIQTDVDANTAKVTNATHTGEVTGATALTVDPSAISGKDLVTAAGADHMLIFDATDSALKKALISDLSGVSDHGALTGLADDDHPQYGLIATGLQQFAATTSLQLLGVLSDETGTGASVFATSPTLVTPALGTPASGVMTNVTGVASGLAAGNLAGGLGGQIPYQSAVNTTALLANGTAGQVLQSNGTTVAPSWVALAGGGDALVANPLSQFAATTSAQLLGVLSDETGTGAAVFATSPTLVTPALGTPASGVMTNVTGTASGLTAGSATNIAGGTAGLIPYQTGAGATAFQAAGTSGQFLTSAGTSAPTWTTPEPPASQTWVIDSPAVGGIYGARIDTTRVIDRIEVWTDTGTIDINIEERTAPNTAGTNTMTADLQGTSTSANQTSFANDSIAAGNWLYLDISAVASSPTVAGITVSYE